MAELLAAWGFEANPIPDESGNGHAITLSGNTVLTAPGNGAHGRGLTQISSETFTAFALPAELQPVQRSWMCNVKFSGSTLGWVGEFYRETDSTGVWGLLNVNGALQFRAKDSSNVERHVNLITPSVFTTITATYDGTNLSVYTDSELIGQIPIPAIWTATHFRLLDGADSVTTIDDMRLFSGALTFEEIEAWRVLPANEQPPGEDPPATGRLKYESAPGIWTPVPLKTETGDPLAVKTETSPGTWEALP